MVNRRGFLASLGALVLAPVAVFRRKPWRLSEHIDEPIAGQHADYYVWNDPVHGNPVFAKVKAGTLGDGEIVKSWSTTGWNGSSAHHPILQAIGTLL